MPDPTPAELLQAAADNLELAPVLIQRTEAGATEDITEPLFGLLETLAVFAELFPTAPMGERLARAILGEGENRG